jgi:formyltetrahydrofolate synthetase
VRISKFKDKKLYANKNSYTDKLKISDLINNIGEVIVENDSVVISDINQKKINSYIEETYYQETEIIVTKTSKNINLSITKTYPTNQKIRTRFHS